MAMSQDAPFLAAVLNGALDGIVSIDESGRVLSFNPAATKLFGYAAEEVIGQSVSVLMPEPYRSEQANYLRNYLETGEAEMTGMRRRVEGRRKDGSIFPIELGVTEIEKDGCRLFIGVIHDLRHSEAPRGMVRRAFFASRCRAGATPPPGSGWREGHIPLRGEWRAALW
jgi:PAS domain S-box-containing protein